MKPVTVVSLTTQGQALAQRIRAHLPEADYLHRPKPFREAVQNRFRVGHRLVLITATGIAVRTLAPVLSNKHKDPAVLVLDEQGRYVIPLLSGHEGGANAWGDWLAQRLNACCVITSAQTYTKTVYVAGLGCERNCSLIELATLLDELLAAQGLEKTDLHALASIELKRDEPALLELACDLELPTAFYSAADLNLYRDRLSRHSAIIFRETGCYGVAEAAALAHAEQLAGTQAELIVPKYIRGRATCALARAYRENI